MQAPLSNASSDSGSSSSSDSGSCEDQTVSEIHEMIVHQVFETIPVVREMLLSVPSTFSGTHIFSQKFKTKHAFVSQIVQQIINPKLGEEPKVEIKKRIGTSALNFQNKTDNVSSRLTQLAFGTNQVAARVFWSATFVPKAACRALLWIYRFSHHADGCFWD